MNDPVRAPRPDPGVGGGAHGRAGRRVVQNDPPLTELIAARWHFGTNGYIGHMGCSHSYPESDRHLNQFLERATSIDVDEMSYRIVELGSEEVFDYPFAYVSEPGEMELTGQEVENLRQFIARGGFVLMDDLDAMAEHVPGGSITCFGLFDADGKLAILAGHNNDLANFWDWYGDGSMPLKPSTDAFRLGANAVVYSMTH